MDSIETVSYTHLDVYKRQVRYETRPGWPETDSQQGVKMHWIEISDHNVNWFTDGAEAEFESDERNDIIREGKINEA